MLDKNPTHTPSVREKCRFQIGIKHSHNTCSKSPRTVMKGNLVCRIWEEYRNTLAADVKTMLEWLTWGSSVLASERIGWKAGQL